MVKFQMLQAIKIMKQFSIFLILLILVSINSFGQQSNRKVNSLVAAENYLSALAKKNGSKDAFLKVLSSIPPLLL